MKLILDDIYDKELKNYLLSQEGIIDIEIVSKDFISEVNINYDGKLTPIIVMKYIELFQNDQSPRMLGFDKKTTYKFKKLRYLVDDMCCEYCYKSLIYELFKNEYIKSVKSNFDFNKPAFNIELLVEYNENYNTKELKKFITKNI